MPTRLGELRELVAGTLTGSSDSPLEELPISGAAILSQVRPEEITFVVDADRLRELQSCPAAAVVTPRGLATGSLPAIEVDDVQAAFAQIVMHFRPPRGARRIGVSPRAVVSPTARLEADVDIHPGATIGDDVEIGVGSTIHSGARIMAGCQIGDNVTIFPNAVLYEGTQVGPRCIIHAGAVLGAYGFGYQQAQGRHVLSVQLGYVEIGADVEVGAGATIDRGTYGPTTVGEGTKIDNLVMIGHNCQIGRHNLLCAQAGIAGSSRTGDYVVLAGQAGVSDHVQIGDRSVLCAQTGVSNDVPNDSVLFGYPGTPLPEQHRCMASYRKLPEMRQQLRDLRRTVEALERRLYGGRNVAA